METESGRVSATMMVRIKLSPAQRLGATRLRRDRGAARVSARRGYARFHLPEGELSGCVDGRMNPSNNRSSSLLWCRDTAPAVASLHLATNSPFWQMERL